MFRRAIVRRMSITAAKALFLASDGAAHAQPRASLPSILEALSEHGLALDERCMTTALAHVMELDRTNEDSLVVGKAEVLRPSSGDTIRLQTTSATSTSDSNTTSPPAALLVVELMKRFPNSPTVRASCCRCIANLCQASGTTPQHNNTAGTPSAHDGDRLVEQGAMEQVIGTLDMYARLNGKERCRAAMAALNLCCLTHEGVSRAVACNAESSLSEFILAMVAEIRDGRPTSEDDLLPGLTHEMCMALDAALGALCAVLAGQAPENSRGISFNFEQASYLAVDALVQALMAMSGVLLRDGRNNGAYDATLSFKRQQIGSGLAFARASPLQQTAVAALLPLLHKAWMGLQSVCGHAPNLPMVYQSIYDVGLGHGGAPAGESRGGDWQRTIDASIFLAVELEGLEAVEELATLQAATRGFLLGCLSPLSAPRKPSPGDEEASGEADPGQLTVAGQSVMEVMTSGTASALALATLVRLHAEHEESLLDASPNVGTSKEVCCAYSADNFHIFSNALLVLSHLGEAGDESVYGSNTVAALHVLLNGASDGIRSLPYLYKDQLFELFRPTSLGQKFEEAAAASGEGVKEGCISADHRLSFLQQSAIVGQVYAVLWSVLRTTNGVTAVVELQLAEAVEAIQTSLQTSYLPAIEEARKAYAKEAAAAAAASAELTAGQPSIKSSSEKESSGDWIPNTAEETVVRLRRLGAETMDQLQSLARAKTSANNSRTTS